MVVPLGKPWAHGPTQLLSPGVGSSEPLPTRAAALTNTAVWSSGPCKVHQEPPRAWHGVGSQQGRAPETPKAALDLAEAAFL